MVAFSMAGVAETAVASGAAFATAGWACAVGTVADVPASTNIARTEIAGRSDFVAAASVKHEMTAELLVVPIAVAITAMAKERRRRAPRPRCSHSR